MEHKMSHYIGTQADEVFVGNTRTKEGIPEYLRNLRTVRLGEQALDREGKELDPAYVRPLFVAKTEFAACDRAMMRRTFPMQFRL